MKYLILLTALLCGTAQAQTIATSPNNAGGEIRLMAGKGSCPEGLRVVLTVASSGEFMSGCWFLMEEKVYATYSDGTKRLYSLDGFTLTQKPAAPQKQRGRSL